MPNPIVTNTASSAKTLAQQIAKQMAREPLEILKSVREQTTNETLSGETAPVFGNSESNAKKIEAQNHEADQLKSGRRMEALQREIEDIRKQNLFKDLQTKISQGETVAINEYTELSIEQKQVLNAQMEAVKVRMQNQQNGQNQVSLPSSKQGRKMGGQKQAAQKEQTRTEKPVQSST